MTRNYYYLVSGLADLALDSGKKVVSFREFVDDVAAALHPDDAALLRLLQYPYDNRNLVAVLEKRDEFDARGSFTRDELVELVKVPDELPGYMAEFADAFKEGKAVVPDMSPLNQITWLFYDTMVEHPNEFIREWFTFDRDLRNILVGLNSRGAAAQEQPVPRPFLLPRAIIGRDDVAESILKSSAPDFSLSTRLLWLDRLLGFHPDTLVEHEKGIDALRWDIITELTTFSYFTIEAILGFALKLGMVERWQQLDEEEGRKRFDMLVEELTSGFEMNKEL